MKKARSLAVSKTVFLISAVKGFFCLFLSQISLKIAGISLIVLSFLTFEFFFPSLGLASGKLGGETFALSSPVPNSTQTLFTEKVIDQNKEVDFSKRTVIDETLAPGETRVIQEGKLGTRLTQTKVTFHSGEEFSREILSVTESPATVEIVAVGAVPKESPINAGIGNLNFSRKLTMWATAYDSNCYGCNGRTASGLKTGFGVVAVDPNVIPLGTKLYIEGYGTAIAGDTGGAIKGNKIDLGFDSVAASGFSSHNVEVYILS